MKKTLLLVNGSIRGTDGNTARLLDEVRRLAEPNVHVREVVLATYIDTVESLADELRRADAIVFGTGVYWSSWGSPLQRFLEIMTVYEATDTILGKPVGVVVTMDSVGGSEVAQRLIGVLSMMGFLTPPLSMVVVSRVGAQLRGTPGFEDVWQADDLDAMVHNVLHATTMERTTWQVWPVSPTTEMTGTYPQSGVLELGVPVFLSHEHEPSARMPPTSASTPSKRLGGRRRMVRLH